MNRIKILLIVLVLSFISIAGFADIMIVYTSGPCKIDLNGNEKWQVAKLHMKLNEHSVIKTGEGGAVEVEIDGHSVALGENTVVSINYIMDNMGKRKKIGWFRIFSGLFSREEGHSKTGLLGVRGAKAEGEEEEMAWMTEEESEDNLKNAISLYKEKKYAEAIGMFEKLYNSENYSDQKDVITYYLGSCYFDGLQYDKASKYLSDAIKNKEGDYYEEALLKYGFSEYFQGDYRNAIKSFTDYTNQFGDRDVVPYVQLMIGKSYKELGDRDSAKRYLKKVMENYRGSEVSKEAAKELGK